MGHRVSKSVACNSEAATNSPVLTQEGVAYPVPTAFAGHASKTATVGGVGGVLDPAEIARQQQQQFLLQQQQQWRQQQKQHNAQPSNGSGNGNGQQSKLQPQAPPPVAARGTSTKPGPLPPQGVATAVREGQRTPGTKATRPAAEVVARSPKQPKLAGSGLDMPTHKRSTSALKNLRRPSLQLARIVSGINFETLYELEAGQMGTGFQGVVRAAVHRITGRRVAVKTITKVSVGELGLQMLRNEVDIMLRLDHPNIVRLYEVYEDDVSVHLVMELCTGGELYERLISKGHYSEATASEVTKQILSAIAYCHQHNICHRDLKLENFLYENKREDADLKLIDFGFGKIFTPGVPMTAVQGTSYYVSPEVLSGRYDSQCDMWSIGVIVYMLLSGKPPFAGKSDTSVLRRVVRGTFRLDTEEFRTVSAEAKDFISGLLQKDPSKRMTAERALKHPWLQESYRRHFATFTLNKEILLSMKRYAQSARLKRAALALIAQSLTEDEIDQLHLSFLSMDKNEDGMLTLPEFMDAISQVPGFTPEESYAIFKAIDMNNTGAIHYSEFLAAALQAKLCIKEADLRQAFERLDRDKTGFISAENLRQVLGDTFNGMPVEDVIAEADVEKRGYIDYEQFLSIMRVATNQMVRSHSDADMRVREAAKGSTTSTASSTLAASIRGITSPQSSTNRRPPVPAWMLNGNGNGSDSNGSSSDSNGNGVRVVAASNPSTASIAPPTNLLENRSLMRPTAASTAGPVAHTMPIAQGTLGPSFVPSGSTAPVPVKLTPPSPATSTAAAAGECRPQQQQAAPRAAAPSSSLRVVG